MPHIVANLVCRNEADAYLPQVLNRLSTQVDAVCVTDDCSDDNTVDVLRSYSGFVAYQVMPEPTFRVNEGALRQSSWDFLSDQLTRSGMDADTLVLAIDADEELYETQVPLRDLAEIRQFDVFNVQFFHMWNDTHFRIDGGWRPHGSTRLFRYMPNGRFRQRALACGSEPEYVQSLVRQYRYCRDTGLAMKHLSYIKDEDKQKKFERYAELDGGAFHAGAHIKSIIDPIEVVALAPWSDIVQ